jgi:ATP-binding cassette subfamily B protein
VLVIAMPVTTMVLGVIVASMVPAFRVMQERIDQINRVLREQITGIRVVRAFVREKEETQRFEVANKDLTTVALRSGRLMSSMFPTVNIMVNLSSVAVIALGAHRVADGKIQVGVIVAFLSYLVQILMSVMMATWMLVIIPRASVSADRVQEVLDTHSSVVPPETGTAPRAKAQIEFRDAGFHYPGADHAVLHNISFLTERGQTTAIIGSSGAGKTSLVNLVARLFDATSGAVFIDGVDVRELDPLALTDRVGLVPQKPFLFSGTVASNLRYGKPDATEEEMWSALRVAQAEDFVRAMPGGLEARIEQGGTNVSGGQRQRLSIARALIRRPEIFVFDDSFSALDLTTDAKLRAALPEYTENSAVLIVAQRVSTISTADQIIVLEDGEIVGHGTHEELIASCETYAEIVQSQIGEKEEVAA